jgi:hypothetical protein
MRFKVNLMCFYFKFRFFYTIIIYIFEYQNNNYKLNKKRHEKN